MIVRECKLKHGTADQYSAIDEAIRTALFIRNKAVRYWMDNQGTSKADLYSICQELAKEFALPKSLIPQHVKLVLNALGLLSLASTPDARRVRGKKVFQSLRSIAVL